MPAQNRFEPPCAEVSLVERECRLPQINIGLRGEIFGAAVGRSVVDGKEGFDAPLTVILKEKRKPLALVANHGATEHLAEGNADAVRGYLGKLVVAERLVESGGPGHQDVDESFVKPCLIRVERQAVAVDVRGFGVAAMCEQEIGQALSGALMIGTR